MSKSRMPLYLALAGAGAGGYYLYRAGGDVDGAKKAMKIDAEKAREKLPTSGDAEKAGANYGKEAGAAVDEAINNARSKFKPDESIPEMAEDGKKKFSELSEDARKRINEGIDKMDRTVEQKAAEAKGTASGWFSGKK
ncbi:hypothetical protein N7523_006088 [Penicillium sp. IBT 18751x]|nr:hypothetical protein N7523_006088 [Penicillium sp. IBT 18751x]